MTTEMAWPADARQEGVTVRRSLHSYVRMSIMAVSALFVCALVMLYVASSVTRQLELHPEQRVVLYFGLCMLLASGYAFHIIGVMAREQKIRQEVEVSRQRTLFEMVDCLASVIEARDPYTGGHQRRVGELARAIAEEMGLSPSEVASIELAATVHDVGKVNVPIEVLTKRGPLTQKERAMLQSHPEMGARIIGKIGRPWPLDEIVRQHHERVDGSGYGAGLTGDQMLVQAKVLAVADVVEAMLANRPYRSPMSVEDVLEEISRHKGVHYDAEVVDACVRVFKEKNFAFSPLAQAPHKVAEVVGEH